MNIEQYRQEKAQIEAELQSQMEVVTGDVQVEQAPIVESQQNVQETQQASVTPTTQTNEVVASTDTQSQPEVPSKITYNDQEFDIEELVNAKAEAETLRQAQAQAQRPNPTTDLAMQYFDKMMSDPSYAKVFAEKNGLPFIDPKEQAVKELETKYNDLLLQREIENMQIKHKDFNPQEVVKFAVDNKIGNLEDAYLLSKARSGAQSTNQALDVDSLKEQIRQELLNEIQSNVNTSTMIGASGGGARQVVDTEVQLSNAEIRVAQNLGMSPKEYSAWKNRK